MRQVTAAYTGIAMRTTSASSALARNRTTRIATRLKRSGQISSAAAVKTGAIWSDWSI